MACEFRFEEGKTRSLDAESRSKNCADLGLHLSHDFILIDEMNRCGSLGVTQGLCAGLQIGVPPIFHFGSEELQKRVLPNLLSGKTRTCLAITEPEVSFSFF